MFTAILLTSATILSSPHLQEDDADTDGKRQKAMEELVERELKAEYQQLLQDAIQFRIRKMQKHIDLDQKSARRLMLAAKGAAKKSVEKYSARISQYAKQRLPAEDVSVNGRMLRLGDKSDDQTEASEAAVAGHRLILIVRRSGASLNIRRSNGSSGYGLNGGYDTILRSDLWKDTIAKVTTPDQIQKFEAIIGEQRRQRTVALITSAFALDLDLEEKQVGQFRAWADTQIKIVTEADIQNGPSFAVSNIGRQLKNDGLDEFLDEHQIAAFKRRVAEWAR
ncbi:MAG: hypothetical protein AB8G99_03085 [Planctomycetaceae bacterium]